MKLISTISFILFFIQSVSSQDKELDSIKKLVETYSKKDPIRVNLLNQLTKYYTVRDISKSETLLQEAIEISKEINYAEGLGSSYTGYSIFYVQSGNYDKGLIYALKAKKIQDSINDVTGLLLTNNCIARIYIHLKKPNEAIKIQLENLKLFENQPLNPQKAGIHFYLANAYSELSSFDKAEFHYKEAKSIAEKTDFKTGIYIANSSLGVLANRRGEHHEAINYLMSALKFYEDNNQIANIAHTNLELAKSYANSGNINKGILLNNKSIKVYQQQNNLKSLQEAYLNQSSFYKQIKDYQNANRFLEKHYHIKDSVFSYEKQVVIEDMQKKYETDKIKKDKALAEQKAIVIINQEKQNKQYLITALTGVCFLFLISLFYFQRIKAKRKAAFLSLELKETQKRMILEKQYKNSELKSLKAQMNPHFMFNAMNSIQNLVLKGNKNEAYDYLTKFSSLIRENLNMSEKSFVYFEEELSLLKKYLELEKLRFRDSFEYQLEGMEAIEDIKIPSMIIQPFVENAIKHGLLHKTNGLKKVTVSFFQENVFKCIITDNGIGYEASKKINALNNNKKYSFSTKAIKDRLSLLKDYYKLDIGFEYEHVEIGTKVVLKIPYKNND